MSLLDSQEAIRAGDPSGTLAAIAGWAGQVRAGVRERAEVPADFDNVLFCGMGGSGIAGDVVASVATLPVVVRRTYGAPAWCGPRTLVVASSYSGNTEETVHAARAAHAAGARGVCVTSGGPLEALGWPVLRPPSGLMPRYALGFMVAAPVATFVHAGLTGLDESWHERAASVLDERVRAWGPGSPTSDNVTKALAHELSGALPVVWGTSPAAVARFVSDLNENAKTPAHGAVLPEADHNEIVGFGADGRERRPPARAVLICLRDGSEDARASLRFRETVSECADSFALTWQHTPPAGDPVTTFFDHAILAAYVSTYLAILRRVDPAPIASIGRLKSALAAE